MKIKKISVYQIDLPLHEGTYKWSVGKSVQVFDSTVVEVETDNGLTGVGEICPLGSVYLPSFAKGARAGIEEVAPHLIGANPIQLGNLNRLMDYSLKGHAYAKSALISPVGTFWDKSPTYPWLNCFGAALERIFYFTELFLKTHRITWLTTWVDIERRVTGNFN